LISLFADLIESAETSNFNDNDLSLVTVAILRLREKIQDIPWKALLPVENKRPMIMQVHDYMYTRCLTQSVQAIVT